MTPLRWKVKMKTWNVPIIYQNHSFLTVPNSDSVWALTELKLFLN